MIETLHRIQPVAPRRDDEVADVLTDDFVSTLPADLVAEFSIDDAPPALPEVPLSIHGQPITEPASPLPMPAMRMSVADRPLSPITALLGRDVETRLTFTGTGAEYFRIWIVNTLFTLLTLGIYSAWAKRRKLRWFARHTFLAGEPFDFHGKPWRILIGRVLALGLVIGYSHAFQWHRWAGWAMLAVLYAFGPALFAGAQRFRLSNTSWRGVRFGFQAKAAVVYASCLPLVVAWTVVTVGVAAGLQQWMVGLAGLAVVGLFPIAHGWLKRFQHQHAVYGNHKFTFDFQVRGFYGLYLALIGVVFLVSMVVGAATVAGGAVFAANTDNQTAMKVTGLWMAFVAGAAMLILAWPTYVARLQRLVWNHTRLTNEVEFRYHLKAGALAKVVATYGLLVPLTLGLYWPFLAVRLARVRVEALTVLSDRPLAELVVPARQNGTGGAVGDAAADAFGLDLGW